MACSWLDHARSDSWARQHPEPKTTTTGERPASDSAAMQISWRTRLRLRTPWNLLHPVHRHDCFVSSSAASRADSGITTPEKELTPPSLSRGNPVQYGPRKYPNPRYADCCPPNFTGVPRADAPLPSNLGTDVLRSVPSQAQAVPAVRCCCRPLSSLSHSPNPPSPDRRLRHQPCPLPTTAFRSPPSRPGLSS